MRKLLLGVLILGMFSCSDSETSVGKQGWCQKLAYGEYTYKSKDEVKVVVTYQKFTPEGHYFTDKGFHIDFELAEDYYEDGTRRCKGVSFAQTVESSGVGYVLNYKDTVMYNSEQSYHFDEVYIEDEKGNIDYQEKIDSALITFLPKNELRLKIGFISSFITEKYGMVLTENIDDVVLTKTQGATECFDFNENISYSSFSEQQVQFIDHDLNQGEGVVRLPKEEMIAYCFDYDTGDWSELVTERIKQYGTTFSLDLNNDSEMDLGGYFVKRNEANSPIYFKVFLNNGVTFNEVFSDNIEEERIHPIYTPDSLNGKTVLQIDYVDKDLTNYLYYDKLEGKLKEYLTD